MNNNKIYNIIRVSDLDAAAELQKLVFFGYDPTKVIEEQSVQIPYALIQNVFDGKQNKLTAGNLVTLTPNTTDNTVKIDVKSDDTKQNKLVNTDGTITISDLPDGKTDIKAILTEGVQIESTGGTKTLEVNERIVKVTSNAELVILGIDSLLNTIEFHNQSNIGVKFNFNATGVSADNQLIKTAVLDIYVLPPNCFVKFLKGASGWNLSTPPAYHPDLIEYASSGKRYAIALNSDGTTNLEELAQMHIIDEGMTSMSLTELNTKYPNAAGGSTVTGTGIQYIKSSDFGDVWQSLTLNTVS